MPDPLLKNLTTLIWDADGTLYPKDEAYFEADYLAVAKVIAGLGIMSAEEAYEKAKQSKVKYGATYDIFLREHNVNFGDLDAAFCEELAKTAASFIKPDEKLIELFNKITPTITHVLLSHGTQKWTEEILNHRRLKHLFEDRNIIGKEKIKSRKSKGPEAFTDVCEKLRAEPSTVAVIEDEPKNLRFPKELGMRTVLISGQNLFPPSRIGFEESIDLTYPKIDKFLHDLVY